MGNITKHIFLDKTMLALYNQRCNRHVTTNKKGAADMVGQNISTEIMGYMVWIVEITAREFFSGNKTLAYKSLKENDVWDLYVEHYDVTHTLGKEYILEEIREIFNEKGVL
jgi:hypothetical protein